MTKDMTEEEKNVRVHPLRVEDMDRFRLWGHHTDLRYMGYDFPDLEVRPGGYGLNKRLWLYKRSVPYLRWLYGIEDPSGNLAGYFKIVKKHIFQKKAELTMILDPASMGKRYGSVALAPLLRICFKDLKLKEVWVRVLAFNARPLRLLEKSGFKCYAVREEPYFDQSHITELMQQYPEDFFMVGNRLMTHFCYLKLSHQLFEDIFEDNQMRPTDPENPV